MKNPALYLLILSLVLYFPVTAFGQMKPPEKQQEALGNSNVKQKRDPFIPLIDREGKLRTDFKKPEMAGGAPRINLMGITRINNVFYAIIDGKWVKEGDIILGDLTIDKIEPDRIIIRLGEKKFEVKLHTEKK